MAERTPPPGLPAGTIPIVRSANATGTLYTVPTGRRLHVVSAWCSLGQPTTTPAAGQLEVVANNAATALLGVVTDLGVARSLVGIAVGDNAAQCQAATRDCQDVPLVAGTLITLTRTGAASSTVHGGFSGWEEPEIAGAV